MPPSHPPPACLAGMSTFALGGRTGSDNSVQITPYLRLQSSSAVVTALYTLHDAPLGTHPPLLVGVVAVRSEP